MGKLYVLEVAMNDNHGARKLFQYVIAADTSGEAIAKFNAAVTVNDPNILMINECVGGVLLMGRLDK